MKIIRVMGIVLASTYVLTQVFVNSVKVFLDVVVKRQSASDGIIWLKMDLIFMGCGVFSLILTARKVVF